MIIALKTDNPVTELYLINPEGSTVEQDINESGNRLSRELLERIERLLQKHQYHLIDITGIIAYKGPGSFTGLRIGLTVANALAYAHYVPITGATGDNWINDSLDKLPDTEPGGQILPEYGSEANITSPRK